MKFKIFCKSLLLFLFVCSISVLFSQDDKEKKEKHPLDEISISGLKFREIGPALTSGRISDFAVNPKKPHEYYVAISSGGVWKTVNSGTTYTPIFDSQKSYSIGCITMDPNNSNVIWVGTGENNNQRSVAYGDGVYKSSDSGASWENMGLKNSEHIGNIIVHPDNSDVIYVAAIGPLWSSGGDRGIYKSEDGGKSWKTVLMIDEHTGVTDMVMDPRDPNVLYAAAYQRARHVFTYLGGGPGSAIYKSTDGGENWEKVNKGLPKVDIGRIGLAISPAEPEIIYAIVEAAQGKSGFYRSTNRGASWQKQGSYSTSGNYYQEIVADPIDANTVYSMNTYLQVSHDGGKTFKRTGERYKHVDNHCMWINPENNKHWLVGCDGGIYETWDASKTWDFKANLPITQFYKVAVDNDLPFYNIYGGTQDNFSMGGPSRTITDHGILNSDWFITHGGDGFESQIDPKNPDIVYAQSQYGVLVRFDRRSGEEVGIQPKARKGENAYRWNWDAPLAVSHHVDGRVYFAANKLFRTDNYGNAWEVISEDLSRQINRNELEIMGRVWSIDAVAKNQSTSPYGTIVAFSESPINPDLLIVGTDDGLIQITSDGGQNWREIDGIKGVPERTYVNAVYASQHDENVIYAAFNHHKYGDFKPYVYKSSDMGKSWQNISNNLPERGSVYSIEEDHVNSNLLFVGTEFGVFFSPDGGGRWKQIKTGLPPIAVRDIAIQRRENDLVLATFGRGFYVLDDYSVLRELTGEKMEEDAMLFSVRDALMFQKSRPLGRSGKGFQGDSYYSGDNLGPVAMISYYYNESYKSRRDQRREQEKKEAKAKKGNNYPSYDDLQAESNEKAPQLIFTIWDSEGNIIRKLQKKPGKGIQRIEWDLRYEGKGPVSLPGGTGMNRFRGQSSGSFVMPGEYTVSLSKHEGDVITEIANRVNFNVIPLDNKVMPADNMKEKVAFQQDVTALAADLQVAQRKMSEMENKMKHMKAALMKMDQPIEDLLIDVNRLEDKLQAVRIKLSGDPLKSRLDIDQPPSPSNRIFRVLYEQRSSSANPTTTHMDSYRIAKDEFYPIMDEINSISKFDIPDLEKKLDEKGAPYTPGRDLIQGNN